MGGAETVNNGRSVNNISARVAEEVRGGGGGGGGKRLGSGGSNNGAVASTSNASRGGNIVERTLASYNALNSAYPTATKVGTSVVILSIGDVTAQRLQHAKSEDAETSFAIDMRRLGAFATFGAVYTGWFQMHWFRALQSWFPSKAVASGAAAAPVSFFSKPVMGPLLLNQFVMIPAGYYPFYFGCTGFLRGMTPKETMSAMREKYKPKLLMTNWAFWLPAQGVQFALVPPSHHILYVSAMGLAWNTILSLTTLGKKETKENYEGAGTGIVV